MPRYNMPDHWEPPVPAWSVNFGGAQSLAVAYFGVGFNANGDQAIVYVANTCGGLCGKGYYVLLTESSGSWKIERDLMLWVS